MTTYRIRHGGHTSSPYETREDALSDLYRLESLDKRAAELWKVDDVGGFFAVERFPVEQAGHATWRVKR
ncbi:MAG: hypothetical protein GY953_42215 [bacterium]|nr:hypothetical protein [bacterium]